MRAEEWVVAVPITLKTLLEYLTEAGRVGSVYRGPGYVGTVYWSRIVTSSHYQTQDQREEKKN